MFAIGSDGKVLRRAGWSAIFDPSLPPGVTAARLALDEVVGVRIPGGQLSEAILLEWFLQGLVSPGVIALGMG